MCTSTARTAPSIIFFVIYLMVLVAEGLPLYRQEHGTGDLIMGEDFLLLIGANNYRTNRQYTTETTTTINEENTTTEIQNQTEVPEIPADPDIPESSEIRETTEIIRETRSTQADISRTFQTHPSDRFNNLDNKIHSSESFSANEDDGIVISMRVSSSVEQSYGPAIKKYKEVSTNEPAVISEEHPSIIAEANKSDFSVEESEPITSNNENTQPSPVSLSYNSAPIYKNPPYQSTLIYHNRDNNRARSVSYSTVIQAIPNIPKAWTSRKNITTAEDYKSATPESSMAESKDYYVTSKYNPSEYNESLEKRNSFEPTSKRYYEPTERNWGVPEKNYGSPPKPYNPSKIYTPQPYTPQPYTPQPYTPQPYKPIVYGQPEQNYEVDEAVSVESNGRAHGIQKVENKPKKDDNQKVGYVVEGRNYRKYRVEERTSDGFIVGEYGVVSHDDGSLRGVRYTADGTINPRLIYDALMKFLAL